MHNHCQIQQKEIMPKVRKAELSFFYATRHLILFYISTKYHQNISPEGIWVTEQTRNQCQKNTKGVNSKRKKARVVTLVCDVSSSPVLHFYQVSSKCSEGCSTYRAQSIIIIKYKKREIMSKVRTAESCHSCKLHVISSCSTFLPSTIIIFQGAFELQSGHEINA